VVDLDNRSGEAARQPSFGRKTMEGFFMITRRGFLRVLAAGAGLAAMKLSFAARLERYLAEHNAPLLEAPERSSLIITACRDMGSLHIGDPYEEAPFKTWREYLRTKARSCQASGSTSDGYVTITASGRARSIPSARPITGSIPGHAAEVPTRSPTGISRTSTSAPSSRAAAPRRDTSTSSACFARRMWWGTREEKNVRDGKV